MQPLASKVLPTACVYACTPNLSCQLGCWQWVNDVLSFASRARSLYFIHCAAALVSVQVRCCSSPDFRPNSSQWSQAPRGTSATKWTRTLWLLSKTSALSSCSPPPVNLKGKPICSNVSQNHGDSSVNSALKAIRLSSNPCTARGDWALHPEDLSQTTVHPTQ